MRDFLFPKTNKTIQDEHFVVLVELIIAGDIGMETGRFDTVVIST